MALHHDHSVVIDAPFDLVWSVTNDVAGWDQLFDHYASVEVLDAAENRVRFRITTLPEAGRTWSWVSERVMDRATGTVHSRRVETGPFEYMRHRWEYRQQPDGVLLRWVTDCAVRPDSPVSEADFDATARLRTPREMDRIRCVLEELAGAAASAGS